MLRIFNEKVVTALMIFSSQQPTNSSAVINDTRSFIEIILKLWKILNVKHPLKGRNLRDRDCDPIRSVNDERLLFLHRFVEWLDIWEAMGDKHRAGLLTRETMSALRHTLKTMILLCKHRMEKLFFKYVLLGKLQTDSLNIISLNTEDYLVQTTMCL